MSHITRWLTLDINWIETTIEMKKKKKQTIYFGNCSQNGSLIASVKGLSSHGDVKDSNLCVEHKSLASLGQATAESEINSVENRLISAQGQ